MSTPVRFGILGLGGRGREAYGGWIQRHPQRASIVAVADPVAARHDTGLPDDVAHFDDWGQLINSLPQLSVDAVIVALPDHLHVEPTKRLLELGIPTLLEKPITPQLAALDSLVAELQRHPTVPVTVGHVLRFTNFWKTIREILDSALVGEIVTLEIRENIGFWHFAHSYVRGSWRNSETSSPMVLAKTCHDLDLIRWLMGTAPSTIGSSGALQYFTPAHRPSGAPDFCIEGCPVEDSCPFYAPRYYLDALRDVHGVPVTLVTSDTSEAGRIQALRHSDYGRCVFSGLNDVADHQSTVMGFPNGATATLTASAFTPENTRHVTITGTAGQVAGHMGTGQITVDLFSPATELTDSIRERVVNEGRRGKLHHRWFELEALPPLTTAGDHAGHAGGDDGLMEEFVSALERGDLRDTEELSIHTALDSHYMAFAAEDARVSGQVIDFNDWMTKRPSDGEVKR